MHVEQRFVTIYTIYGTYVYGRYVYFITIFYSFFLMFSFRYFCTSSDNRLARRNGMGWGWCWGWAGSVSPLTGVGAGLERVHEAIKLG